MLSWARRGEEDPYSAPCFGEICTELLLVPRLLPTWGSTEGRRDSAALLSHVRTSMLSPKDGPRGQ